MCGGVECTCLSIFQNPYSPGGATDGLMLTRKFFGAILLVLAGAETGVQPISVLKPSCCAGDKMKQNNAHSTMEAGKNCTTIIVQHSSWRAIEPRRLPETELPIWTTRATSQRRLVYPRRNSFYSWFSYSSTFKLERGILELIAGPHRREQNDSRRVHQ